MRGVKILIKINGHMCLALCQQNLRDHFTYLRLKTLYRSRSVITMLVWWSSSHSGSLENGVNIWTVLVDF